ncbi:DUF2938 family protein [Sphingopyxis sp. R3-92]|uniref:DUF2938 family protein n=1 Tax=Sphingopyxis sp. R3-92 TaxID=3158553 RepID=UPI003EE5B4BD
MTLAETVVRAALVGIGGTIILDLYAQAVKRLFGMPVTNWRMVGRWLGRMVRGDFVQADVATAEPVTGEYALGWIFHYIVGAGYGLLVVAIWGARWLADPWLLPPLTVALVLLVLPFFVMMPGMGLGIAGSRTPRPHLTRMKSALGHSVFGFGMYLTAASLERIG